MAIASLDTSRRGDGNHPLLDGITHVSKSSMATNNSNNDTPSPLPPSNNPSSSLSSSSSWAFLITGASRGLGQAIAIVANEYLSTKCSTLHFVLTARSMIGLQTTKESILGSETTTKPPPSSLQDPPMTDNNDGPSSKAKVSVVCHEVDLSNLDELDHNLDTILSDIPVHRFDRIVFINNAGSIGHLGPCITSPSLQSMRKNVDLNVTSCLWSSVRFARHIQQDATVAYNSSSNNRRDVIVDATIVNISSLVAISDDFVTMGIYSAGKAAREKYHTLFAAECEKIVATTTTKQQQQHNNNDNVISTNSRDDEEIETGYVRLKTLNYAPGPLETDMTEQIRNSVELDVDLGKNFQTQLLDAKDSARKLIVLLDENTLRSGSHIDFYDLPNVEAG